MAENVGNDFSTSLGGAISDGVTTAITVASGAGAPNPNFRIRIDGELMLVTSVGGGTNWAVVRGIEGTTGASHLNGSTVAHVVSKGGLDQYLLDQYINTAARQTVLAGAVDSSGYANMLAAGSGLALNLSAATTPMVASFANGFGNLGGASDFITQLSADVTSVVSSLAASNTSYISVDYLTGSSGTWGKYLVPPQYGYTFDRTQNSLLHFEQAAGAPLCDFGNTYTLSGATITTTKPPYGARCLDISGGATGGGNVKNAFTTDITTLGPDSWEISLVFWHDVAPVSPSAHYVFGAVNGSQMGVEFGWYNNGGTNRFVLNVSSDGSSRNIANLSVGTAVPATGHWYKYRCQFDALAGKYRLFISDGGTAATPTWAAETKDIEVTSTARVCAITRIVWGCTWTGAAFTNGASGFLDEAQITRCATNTSTETPTGYPKAATDQPVNFFSIPQMKMFEVTAASGTAGVNPTLTQRQRVFVAECDTSGAAVTAVRNYALRGQYVSPETAVGGLSTRTSVNHNIGVRPLSVDVRLVNKTADVGHVPGDVATGLITYDATGGTFPGVLRPVTDRNSMSVASASTVAVAVCNKTTGAEGGITAASWKYVFRADRGF